MSFRYFVTANISARTHRPMSSRNDIIRMMVGREITQMFPKEVVPIGDVVLSVRKSQSRQCLP